MSEYGEYGKTVVVRLPDDLAESLKCLGGLQGKTPGDVMAEAWNWWWEANSENIIPELHRIVDALGPIPKQPSHEAEK